jgi:hypothetical protein
MGDVMHALRFTMKHFTFALVLLTAAANVFAERPKKPQPSAAVDSDPVVGKWTVERAQKEDVVWIFNANHTLERISKNMHEKGRWHKLSDLTPPAYQCVLNSGAAIIKVTYSADPEHLSLLMEDNRTRTTAKRLHVK